MRIEKISDLEKLTKKDLIKLIRHLGYNDGYSRVSPELIAKHRDCGWHSSRCSLDEWLVSDDCKRSSILFDEISLVGINNVIDLV